MEIGVRDLLQPHRPGDRSRAGGERVVLTVHGKPVADTVPHARRTRWLSGSGVRRELATRAADPALTSELDELAGQTIDDLTVVQ